MARINLAQNLGFNPVNALEGRTFDPESGAGVVEIQSAARAQRKKLDFLLSNEVGRSTGIKVNTAYGHWGDRVISFGPVGVSPTGMGAAGSLDAARTAFENATGGQEQRIKAVILRGMVDGWIDPLLAGT